MLTDCGQNGENKKLFYIHRIVTGYPSVDNEFSNREKTP